MGAAFIVMVESKNTSTAENIINLKSRILDTGIQQNKILYFMRKKIFFNSKFTHHQQKKGTYLLEEISLNVHQYFLVPALKLILYLNKKLYYLYFNFSASSQSLVHENFFGESLGPKSTRLGQSNSFNQTQYFGAEEVRN